MSQRGGEVSQIVDEATAQEKAAELVAARAELGRYRSMFETMTEGFALHEIVCDSQGVPVDYRFLDVNPAFERQTGLARARVVGHLASEVVPGEDAGWIERYGQVALTGVPVHFEHESLALGRHFEVFSFCPAPGQFSVLFLDVTRRKQMERAVQESEQHYRMLFETMLQGVVYQDADGTILSMNPAAERILGKTAAEFVGQTSVDVEHHTLRTDGSPFPGSEHPAMVALRTGQQVHSVVMGVYNPRQQGYRWIDISAVPVFRPGHDEPHQVYTLFHDVTERRQAELELRESQAQLRTLADALHDADRRRNEFLAVLSHELRNPLAPIRNSLFVLGRAAPSGEQARRSLSVIERQVGQLSRLVDDLLDVTRITRGKIQLQLGRLELGELVRRTIEDYRSVFTAAGIELIWQPARRSLYLDGDPARLSQAVGNLLHNAGKFTPEGGHVQVSLEVEEEAPQQAVIRVRDDGVGIPAEELPRLFQPFEQAGNRFDRGRGLGLGLALVRGFVELHGGRVEAASRGPGQGTVFTLHLPLVQSGIPHSAATSLPGGPTPRRVLLIEDNLDAAASLREVLELDGHLVEEAHDGPSGVRLAREFDPDVVVCDIGLPGLDGYGVARALRQDQTLGGIHLVALSGYAMPEDLARARDAGFDEHLAKPADLQRLAEIFAGVTPRPR